jgi:hypothetical protein
MASIENQVIPHDMLPEVSAEEEQVSEEEEDVAPGSMRGGVHQSTTKVDGLSLAPEEVIQGDDHLPAETVEPAELFPAAWKHLQKPNVPINPISTMHMQYASAGYHMSVRNHGFAKWKDGAPMQVQFILNDCILLCTN